LHIIIGQQAIGKETGDAMWNVACITMMMMMMMMMR